MRRSWGESEELSLSCGLPFFGLPFFGEDGEPVVAGEDCTAEGTSGNSLASGSEVFAMAAGGSDEFEGSFAESASGRLVSLAYSSMGGAKLLYTFDGPNHFRETCHTVDATPEGIFGYQISTTDRTHARTGPDTQRAQAHNHTQNSNPRTQPACRHRPSFRCLASWWGRILEGSRCCSRECCASRQLKVLRRSRSRRAPMASIGTAPFARCGLVRVGGVLARCVETAMSIEFASGTGPASAIVTDREWIRWNEVFTPVPGAEE